MNRTELTQAIVWLDQIQAKAKEESGILRSRLAAEAKLELDSQGTAPTWRIPDVATIAASVTHDSVSVTDEKAFTEWAARHYPTEVDTVTVVRPAWRSHLLALVAATGCAPDGEVIPGLTIRPGGEFAGVSIRVSAAAKEAFAAVAGHALRQMAVTAGPLVPVVLAELERADA